MSLRAGELCHRIRIEKKTQDRDEDGNFLEPSWQIHTSLWARVTWLSVKDTLTAQANNSEVVARCKLRKRNDIDTTMRVVYDGKIYSITGEPLPDAENGKIYMTLILSCGVEK
ncbi:phage head closure protein [Acinetobacter sp. 194]|uniref:phage head closure protein n=1 Tax=Acinetobacter shaoyimingii TaxID=2715164 RepID=UPI00140B4D8A|nr:phage head closure protein [Acinetobacter shaoyimingii]NHB57022.1 phage head closure protein [Acinetobacter shaoyimingii]